MARVPFLLLLAFLASKGCSGPINPSSSDPSPSPTYPRGKANATIFENIALIRQLEGNFARNSSLVFMGGGATQDGRVSADFSWRYQFGYTTDRFHVVHQEYNLLDGTDWQHMLTKAGMEQRWVATKTSILPNCTEVETRNTDTSIVWIYSFNEWGEGSGLEPLESRNPPYPYGFGSDPLQIAQTALGATGATSLPPEPVQRFPEGTVEGLRPPFSWDEVQFGQEYHIKIKDSANQVIVDDFTNEPDYRPTGDMVAGQPYTWRVAGRNNVGWGQFSPNMEFTPTPQCLAAPLAPQPIAPVGCVDSVRPTFSWNASTCAADYQVDVARVSPEEHLPYCGTQGTTCVLGTDLLPGVEYRWKVKANNSQGSNWSQLTYFTPICGPAASIGDASVAEGNTGTAEALVSVSLTAPSGTTVTVSYSTANGSAIAGSDYEVALAASADRRARGLAHGRHDPGCHGRPAAQCAGQRWSQLAGRGSGGPQR